jgi:hypothetical protein
LDSDTVVKKGVIKNATKTPVIIVVAQC